MICLLLLLHLQLAVYGANLTSIANLINRRNYYFVPFRQDNPITKPRSIVFDPEYILKTIEFALDGEQIQPILL